MGRFISKDPIGFGGEDTNLYRYVEISPQGYTDSSGLKKNFFFKDGILYLYNDDGKLIYKGPSVSGPYGNGKLPKGLYTVGKLRDNRNGSYACAGSTGYSLNLEPQFSTDRTDLRVHPDGGVPGTLGCIGIKCENGNADSLGKLCEIFTNNQ